MHPRTCLALRAGLLAIGLSFGQFAAASPPYGRMPPDERERLRQELREQRRAERARDADAEQRRMPVAPAPGAGEPSGWANPQPAQPSGMPWRRDESGVGMGRGAGPQQGPEPRERLSPEERRQLRTLLRERHREMRERRADDGR